mmetsp:Transcript_103182/g.289069  ORF Transcript_103182/g.289069 Transcript_103182/m.289069 type:complete len:235 (+) Transcript_103182:128-832(+)
MPVRAASSAASSLFMLSAWTTLSASTSRFSSATSSESAAPAAGEPSEAPGAMRCGGGGGTCAPSLGRGLEGSAAMAIGSRGASASTDANSTFVDVHSICSSKAESRSRRRSISLTQRLCSSMTEFIASEVANAAAHPLQVAAAGSASPSAAGSPRGASLAMGQTPDVSGEDRRGQTPPQEFSAMRRRSGGGAPLQLRRAGAASGARPHTHRGPPVQRRTACQRRRRLGRGATNS